MTNLQLKNRVTEILSSINQKWLILGGAVISGLSCILNLWNLNNYVGVQFWLNLCWTVWFGVWTMFFTGQYLKIIEQESRFTGLEAMIKKANGK